MIGVTKYLNIIETAYSYLSGSILHRPVIFGMPPSISVELTNQCNLRCPECPTGSGKLTRERGYMDPGFFSRFMRELKPYIYNTNLYFQGEPMLHPEFSSFLRETTDIYTTVSTNGHFLSVGNSERIVKSGLNRLIISLDGLDQNSYSAYRINGKLDIVIAGIKKVAEAKKIYNSGIRIVIQVLVNRYNEHQIPGIRKLAESLNISLELKSMQVYEKSVIDSWMPSDRKFRRYLVKNGVYSIKSCFPDRCARLWFNPVITWDGKVLPCCFDKDAAYVMGDLKKDSFRKIWHGEEFRNFRKLVLSCRSEIDICRNCTSGLRGVRS